MPAPPVPAAEAARQRAQRLRLRRRITAAIYAVPLFFLACALYLYFGPKPPPPPAFIPVTAQQTAQAEQHIDAVTQALTQPQAPAAPAKPSSPQAAPAPEPPPNTPTPVRHVRGPEGEDMITLQLTEADINAYLAGNKSLRARLESKGVHAVTVDLRPPHNIIFHANATIKSVTDNALVAAVLAPDPRTAVSLRVTDARFGRLPPAAVQVVANKIVAQMLVPPSHPLPLIVRKVEVQGTNLVLTGVEAPAAPSK